VREAIAGGLVVTDRFGNELRIQGDRWLRLVVGECGTHFLDHAFGAELHQSVVAQVAELLVIADEGPLAARFQREQVLAVEAARVTDAEQPQQRWRDVDLAQAALDPSGRDMRRRVDP
jgi:hypothetical protein